MNEKRFSVRLRSECDGVVYSFFDGDKPIDVDMIVDLLNEQQATIENYRKSRDKWRTKCHQAEEKVEYWKHKSLDLYKLLRRVNLSDKEWEEFLNIINEKELEDV